MITKYYTIEHCSKGNLYYNWFINSYNCIDATTLNKLWNNVIWVRIHKIASSVYRFSNILYRLFICSVLYSVLENKHIDWFIDRLIDWRYVDCVDIDECEDDNPCAHNCHNTEGSYYCSCNDSYTLKADKFGCKGELRPVASLIKSANSYGSV